MAVTPRTRRISRIPWVNAPCTVPSAAAVGGHDTDGLCAHNQHQVEHLAKLPPEGERDLFEYVSSQIDHAGDRERGQEQAAARRATGGQEAFA